MYLRDKQFSATDESWRLSFVFILDTVGPSFQTLEGAPCFPSTGLTGSPEAGGL